MFGIKARRSKRGKEEAEKPFWISFSDLMTALMVLFLVAMAVALMAVTKPGDERGTGIGSCMQKMQNLASREGFTVKDYSIEFGEAAEFKDDDHRLDPDQERRVRAFMPKVLEAAGNPDCNRWLKRVVVEGFASPKDKQGKPGSYLYNLNLSFLRSQRILCVVLDSQAGDALEPDVRGRIKTLFFAGGSSFSTMGKSDDQMRRVELKLEFLGLDESREKREIPLGGDDSCPNDSR